MEKALQRRVKTLLRWRGDGIADQRILRRLFARNGPTPQDASATFVHVASWRYKRSIHGREERLQQLRPYGYMQLYPAASPLWYVARLGILQRLHFHKLVCIIDGQAETPVQALES